jgi:hypothetical protein
MEAGAGVVYKLLLTYNYTIVPNELNNNIKKLVKNNNTIASVDTTDIVEYLAVKHTTYKLFVKRIEELKKSKLQSKRDLIPTHQVGLEQIIDIYTAKYLFKQLPLSIKVKYLK